MAEAALVSPHVLLLTGVVGQAMAARPCPITPPWAAPDAPITQVAAGSSCVLT